MSKRIRYKKTANPDIYRSAQTYSHPSNGGVFSVQLEMSSLKFSILDELVKVTVLEGSESSQHKLKKRVKTEMETLGVVFESEGRVKRTEVV